MQNQQKLIKQVLSDKKATDIIVYDFKGGFFIHETMIVASVNNTRLLDAIGDYVVEALEEKAYPIHHIEGDADCGWILIDTPEILIHLFLEDTRAFYQLDQLWADKKVETYVD